MRTQKAKNTYMAIKQTTEYGWQSTLPRATQDFPTRRVFDAAAPTRIVPLGALHKKNRRVHESDVSQVDGVDFLRTQAYAGGFTPLTGKTQFSSSMDGDNQELQDVTLPKIYVRGHDSYSANLDLWHRKAENLWVGAVNRGEFISERPAYRRSLDFPSFEIWVLENPDVRKPSVASADLLKKYIGVIFNKNDEAFENPEKWSLSANIIAREEYPMWVKPTQADLIPGGTVDPTAVDSVDGSTTDDSAVVTGTNDAHTRLVLRLSATALALANPVVFTVIGCDIAGYPIMEEIEVDAGDIGNVIANAIDFFTHSYFYGDFTVGWEDGGDISGGAEALIVKDWDFAPFQVAPKVI